MLLLQTDETAVLQCFYSVKQPKTLLNTVKLNTVNNTLISQSALLADISANMKNKVKLAYLVSAATTTSLFLFYFMFYSMWNNNTSEKCLFLFNYCCSELTSSSADNTGQVSAVFPRAFTLKAQPAVCLALPWRQDGGNGLVWQPVVTYKWPKYTHIVYIFIFHIP